MPSCVAAAPKLDLGLVRFVYQTDFGQQHVQALIDSGRFAVLTGNSPLGLRQNRITDCRGQKQDAHPFQDNRPKQVRACGERVAFATAVGVSFSCHSRSSVCYRDLVARAEVALRLEPRLGTVSDTRAAGRLFAKSFESVCHH